MLLLLTEDTWIENWLTFLSIINHTVFEFKGKCPLLFFNFAFFCPLPPSLLPPAASSKHISAVNTALQRTCQFTLCWYLVSVKPSIIMTHWYADGSWNKAESWQNSLWMNGTSWQWCKWLSLIYLWFSQELWNCPFIWPTRHFSIWKWHKFVCSLKNLKYKSFLWCGNTVVMVCLCLRTKTM